MTPPVTFPLCIVTDCPLVDRCLRRQALLELEGPRRDTLPIINPFDLTTGDACPHFLEAKTTAMAAGFRGAMGAMPSSNVAAAKAAIAEIFSLRTYFRLRNGERAMTPAEQQAVAEVLERLGAPAPVRFDRYYDDYVWF